MATAHQLSTIKNFCVKVPVNPKTGASFTQDKRPDGTDKGLVDDSALYGRDADYLDDLETPGQLSRSRNLFDSTLINTLPADLADMTQEEFYKNLVDLRNEHKKTLQVCEQLYSQKLSETKLNSSKKDDIVLNGTAVGEPAPKESPPIAEVNDEYELSTSKQDDSKQEPLALVAWEDTEATQSKKPPTGKPNPRVSDTEPTRSHKIAPAYNAKSYDPDFWRPLTAASSDAELSDEEKYSKREQQSEKTTAVDKYIDDMWKNFSIDELAPRRKLYRSNSLSKLSTIRSSTEKVLRANEPKKSNEWRHRITIPKPFSMSLREATTDPKKTRAMLEVEEKRLEQLKKEQEECAKKFKATPVPAHVYLPLYDGIMGEKEAKRRRVREEAKAVLKSTEKPFSFYTREEEKKSAGYKSHKTCDWKDDDPTTTFKAKPFPAHLFDNAIDEKLKEEEEFRKLRAEVRAQEIYKSSSLPPNMQSRGGDYFRGKSRTVSSAKKSKLGPEPKFRPKINKTVPDFDELHKKNMTALANKKIAKEATVCKPFNLRESGDVAARSRVYADIDDESLQDSRWPYKYASSMSRSGLNGSLCGSLDSIPAKMTNSAHLRKSLTQMKKLKKKEGELEREKARLQRMLREEKMQKEVSRRVAAHDHTSELSDHSKNKLYEHRQADKLRRKEYEEELRAMNDKIKNRPFMFEQISAENAQRAAQRRYKSTLNSVGLDEQFVEEKGHRASNASSRVDEMFSDRGHSRHSSERSQHYTSDFDTGTGSKHHRDDDTDEGSAYSDIQEDYA